MVCGLEVNSDICPVCTVFTSDICESCNQAIPLCVCGKYSNDDQAGETNKTENAETESQVNNQELQNHYE